MESAKRAADVIIRALAKNHVGVGAFTEYEQTLRAGMDIWREFILLYYRLPPLFIDLIARPTRVASSPDCCREMSMTGHPRRFWDKCATRSKSWPLTGNIPGTRI